MLIEAAANEWSVPAAEISASNSVLTHKSSGRSATHGAFAAAAGKLEPPKDVVLKDPSKWKIIGQSKPRLDTAGKVDGSLIYAIDIKRPGMLNAAIRDCPTFGGKLVSFDADKVSSMPGVRHVLRVEARLSPWWPTLGGKPKRLSTRCPSFGTMAQTAQCPALRLPKR
jgi:isoquinoline 1-oxidoreductase beta subunit